MSEYSDWVPAMLTSVFGGFITKIESLCIVLTTRPARSDFTLNSISDRLLSWGWPGRQLIHLPLQKRWINSVPYNVVLDPLIVAEINGHERISLGKFHCALCCWWLGQRDLCSTWCLCITVNDIYELTSRAMNGSLPLKLANVKSCANLHFICLMH